MSGRHRRVAAMATQSRDLSSRALGLIAELERKDPWRPASSPVPRLCCPRDHIDQYVSRLGEPSLVCWIVLWLFWNSVFLLSVAVEYCVWVTDEVLALILRILRVFFLKHENQPRVLLWERFLKPLEEPKHYHAE